MFLNELMLVLLCSGLTFLATVLGSSIVYFCKNVNLKFEKACLGLASGIMIAASFFSLIFPAIEANKIFSIVGMILGFLLIYVLKIINLKIKKENKSLFFLAVTLHNIPEGMIVGLTCSLACSNVKYSVIGAIMLAVGIAIQNIPEGIATVFPLIREGENKHKAFFKGVISGIVEPISAFIMCFVANYISNLMPLFLCLAAGSMLYVVVDELLPECSDNEYNIGGIMFSIGFIIMMALDIIL